MSFHYIRVVDFHTGGYWIDIVKECGDMGIEKDLNAVVEPAIKRTVHKRAATGFSLLDGQGRTITG